MNTTQEPTLPDVLARAKLRAEQGLLSVAFAYIDDYAYRRWKGEAEPVGGDDLARAISRQIRQAEGGAA